MTGAGAKTRIAVWSGVLGTRARNFFGYEIAPVFSSAVRPLRILCEFLSAALSSGADDILAGRS